MRRLYLAASGLGLSVAVSLAMANPPVTPAHVPLADVTYVPVAAEPAATEEKAADPEAVLREEYLKLMEEKAALMGQAELEAALSVAQQDIRELEAEQLLAEARAIIQRVHDEYPKTRAAGEAAAIMNQARPSPVSGGDFRPL